MAWFDSFIHGEALTEIFLEGHNPYAHLKLEAADLDAIRQQVRVSETLLGYVTGRVVGAGRHERSGERTTWRNGYRERALDTRLGTLNLKVPKLRKGSYFPGFLEPRRMAEKALTAASGADKPALEERKKAAEAARKEIGRAHV